MPEGFRCCSEPAQLAEDPGASVPERTLAEPPARPGSWQAGTHARTGLAACIGGWSLPSNQGSSVAPSSSPEQALQQSSRRPDNTDVSGAQLCSAQQLWASAPASLALAKDVRLKRQAFLDKVQLGEGLLSDNSSISEDEILHEHSLACKNKTRLAQHRKDSSSGEREQRTQEAEHASSTEKAEQAGADGGSSEQSWALQLQDAPRQLVPADAVEKAVEHHLHMSRMQKEGQVGVEESFQQAAALRVQDNATEGALSRVPTTTVEDRVHASDNRQGHQQETCGICFNTMQHICVSHPAIPRLAPTAIHF